MAMDKLQELLARYEKLGTCADDIKRSAELMLDTYRKGGKILVCGNGGSAADAEHIVGELMKGFLLSRPITEEQKDQFARALGKADGEIFAKKLQRGIPAISLCGENALSSAYSNDVDADYVYAQRVFGLGGEKDLLIGISTSGNSKNVVNAVKTALALGIPCVALTGERESELSHLATVTVRVPETETYKVQELHLPVYHYLCAEVEAMAFGE